MDTNNILKIINGHLLESEKVKNYFNNTKIISERRIDLYDYKWLKELLNDVGVNTIATDNIPMPQLLQNFGEVSIDVYILFTDGRSGSNFLSSISEKIKQIRSIVPNIGIFLISTNNNININQNLLPPRTWIITPSSKSEDIKNYLHETKYALNNSFSIRESFQPALISNHEIQHTESLGDWTLPNFNIKHPSMLLPIGNVALKNNTPVFVEISPQEALVYYDYMSSENDVYKRLTKVFQNIRADVDWLKKQTGIKMFLHLDHCNDKNIIQYALDCGFNSVMADGSNQTLRENIRFVQNIKKISESYNVPVEGEIGAIDLSGYSKTFTTVCSELDVFVKETNVDFVGVNVRQFHGCDYGFDRSRMAYLNYIERNHKKNYCALNLIESCEKIDKILEEKEYSYDSLERTTIKDFIDKIVYTTEADLISIISFYLANSSISINYWFNEILSEWNFKQKKMIDENQKLLEEVIGFGMKNDTVEKNLDFDLLAKIAMRLKKTNTNIVLHGGSSIFREDLRYLNNYKVKRVNFGSHPYQLYINSLKNEAVGRYNYKDKLLSYNPLESSFFVTKCAAEWKSWVDNKPCFLSDYEYEIENRFFKPIINKY